MLGGTGDEPTLEELAWRQLGGLLELGEIGCSEWGGVGSPVATETP